MNINDGPSIERVWGSGRVFSDARFKLDGKPTARAVHSNASNACNQWVHSHHHFWILLFQTNDIIELDLTVTLLCN